MIKSFNVWLFKGICFIGLLSLLFSAPLDQKALVLIILLIFWSPARRFVGNLFRGLFRGIWGGVWGTTKLMAKATVGTGKFLFTGLQRPSGRFMPWWKRWYWFDQSKRGFLLDGHKKRLPLKVSYQGSILQGGMGTGKSSVFVIPNLLMPVSYTHLTLPTTPYV